MRLVQLMSVGCEFLDLVVGQALRVHLSLQTGPLPFLVLTALLCAPILGDHYQQAELNAPTSAIRLVNSSICFCIRSDLSCRLETYLRMASMSFWQKPRSFCLTSSSDWLEA
jgi:hypothetical protein